MCLFVPLNVGLNIGPRQQPLATVFVRVKVVLDVKRNPHTCRYRAPISISSPPSLFSASGSFSLSVSLSISSKFLSILIFWANKFTERCDLRTTIHFYFYGVCSYMIDISGTEKFVLFPDLVSYTIGIVAQMHR